MKKAIYILAVTFGLGVVSCQKQIIEPCSDRGHEIPEWNSSESIFSKSASTIDDDAITGGSLHGDVDITDPNYDPDGKGKGK